MRKLSSNSPFYIKFEGSDEASINNFFAYF